MATKFLDKTGLHYFWSKIKAWCNSLFALDSDVIHKTGNETITGAKTFSSTITGSISGNAATATEADHLSPHPLGSDYEMTAADFPAPGYYSVTSFKADTSSAPSGNAGDYRLYAFSGNSNFNDFLCTSPRQASLFFGHFWEGVFGGWYELCTLDTSQTITGTKTFTKSTYYKNTNVTRGTAPSANAEIGFAINDVTDTHLSALTTIYYTNKSSFTGIYAYNTTIASGANIGSLGIGCDASGNVYTKAPTPASSDNSTQIATTAYVKNQGYITSSGNASGLDSTGLGSNYEMTHTDFANKGIGIWKADFKANTTSAPRYNDGDFAIMKLYNTTGTSYAQFLCMSPRRDILYFGKFWDGTWQKWHEIFSSAANIRLDIGSTIYRSIDTSALWVCGGTSIDSSSCICVTGQNDVNAGRFSCVAKKGSTSRSLVGIYNGNLTWNGQTIQTSSDARLKTSLTSVPDTVLDAWSNVDWGQFKFLAAIEEKGDSARQHVGLIAQQVLAAFDARGMDACDYGIACHDIWDDEYYEDTVTGEKTLINKAGETWMIRYTEALCMEAAYQRRKNKILEKRISDLEEQLSSVLEILNNLKGA